MDNDPAKQKLLDDILDEEDYTGFLEALRQRCAAELRRLRRLRLAFTVAAAAAAAVFILGAALWLQGRPGGPSGDRPELPDERPPAYLVVTRPLDPGRIVHTRPVAGSVTGRIIVSSASGSLPPDLIVRSYLPPTLLTWIYTGGEKRSLELLSDHDLLALFPNRPRGLLPARDGGKRLVFFDRGKIR